MEIEKIEEQIIKIQQEKKAAIKKLQDQKRKAILKRDLEASTELLKFCFGKDWFKIYDQIIKSPDTQIEIFINGSKLEKEPLPQNSN